MHIYSYAVIQFDTSNPKLRYIYIYTLHPLSKSNPCVIFPATWQSPGEFPRGICSEIYGRREPLELFWQSLGNRHLKGGKYELLISLWLCITTQLPYAEIFIPTAAQAWCGWDYHGIQREYLVGISLYIYWLVVDLPLWKIRLRQLGWWHSQLNGKS